MEEERVKRFIQLIKMYNDEPNKRVFRVDRDCYVIFTGFSAFDERPFVRIGYSNYLEKVKEHISNVIITAGYLSSLRDEIKQIETEEFDTNFIVPESIYNVFLKFLSSDSHHKVNMNIIDKQGLVDYSSVVAEVSQRYKSYVLLYEDGNFAITFSGKKIFDMFSVINKDLTTSKFLSLVSDKTKDIYPKNSVIRLANCHLILTSSGQIAVVGKEFDEDKLIKNLYPTSKIKIIVGNDVLSLIDFIKLVWNRSSLKIYTTKEVYEDFKKFSLGIRFVDISDRINVIKNINIVSDKDRYYIPLKDKDGNENELVMEREKTNLKNPIILEEGEIFLLDNFTKSKLSCIVSDIFLTDPDNSNLDEIIKEFEESASQVFSRGVLAEILKDFESDTKRIIRDRRRLEELIELYYEVSSLSLNERADIFIKTEKLEGTEKEKEVKSSVVGKDLGNSRYGVRGRKSKRDIGIQLVKKKNFLTFFSDKWWIIVLVAILLILGGIALVSKDMIGKALLEIQQTSEEKKIGTILNKLDSTYEPELTKIQNDLGITITDYDIWIYVNKVAVINGYKPLTYRRPKKWEDPDWIFPGVRLTLVDGSTIIVRENDNMWNISKRKLIEDYIKKNFAIITVKSKAGTNVYYVKKKTNR